MGDGEHSAANIRGQPTVGAQLMPNSHPRLRPISSFYLVGGCGNFTALAILHNSAYIAGHFPQLPSYLSLLKIMARKQASRLITTKLRKTARMIERQEMIDELLAPLGM